LQDFVVQNSFCTSNVLRTSPQHRDFVTQLRARSHLRESNALRACPHPRDFVTRSWARSYDYATAREQALAVAHILTKLSRKKYTSVRNGGIQRRSPNLGGVMPGLNI